MQEIHPTESLRQSVALLCALVALATGGVGCTTETVEPAPQSALRSPSPSSPVEPIMTRHVDGIEVQWWISPDVQGAVGREFARDALVQSGVSPHQEAMWRANGVRIVRLSRSRFREVVESMPVIHARQREWIGWSAQWREVYRGRHVGGDADVVVFGERTSLPHGILRLLARCWPAPSDRGQVARLELGIQVFEEREPSTRDIFSEPRMEDQRSQGLVLSDLMLELVLDRDSVYVLTSELPGVEWELPRASIGSAEEGAGESEGEDRSHEHGPRHEMGPRVSPLPTIGDALFAASAEDTRSNPMKVVLVVIPRLSGEYELLP